MDAEPWEVHEGSCLDVMPRLPAGLAQTCCTSPPYYGLRDYGTAKWEGGDPGCGHVASTQPGSSPRNTLDPDGHLPATNAANHPVPTHHRSLCPRCGAVRGGSDWPAVEYAPMPGLPPVAVPAMRCELGLEPTPEAYVGHLVLVFRQVRRVLRPDGLLALNLGDSYASSGTYDRSASERLHAWQGDGKRRQAGPKTSGGGKGSASCPSDLKPKDLLGIPWRVAFALQSDGWWLRSDVIWAKLSPMPQSVRDRPTAAHEYVFLLAPSATYFYDQDAERMPGKDPEDDARRMRQSWENGSAHKASSISATYTQVDAPRTPNPDGRNLWTHWQDIADGDGVLCKLRDDLTPEQVAYVVQRMYGRGA
jgi:DNA modification methylase